MTLRVLRRGFSKIAVLAGTSRSDRLGAKVLQHLKAVAPQTTFFGIGGQQMVAGGLQSNASIDVMPARPFYPLIHFRVDPRFWLSPFLMYENLRLVFPFWTIYSNGFWGHFKKEAKADVDMVVTLDHQLFAFRFFEVMSLFYRDGRALQPLRVHVGDTVRNFCYDHLRSIDFLLYSTPIKSEDPQQFAFPSQFVGKQGVFDALRHVLLSSVRHRGAVERDFLRVDPEDLFEAVRQFKIASRRTYRDRLGFEQNSWMLYFHLGTTRREVKANLRVMNQAVAHFRTLIEPGTQVSLVLSLPDNKEEFAWVARSLADSGVPTRFIYGLDNPERFDALAAADLGAINNGDALYEAAALQLPTVALDPVKASKGYVTLMHNLYAAEINLVVGGLFVPEMTLWNTSRKLIELWEPWMADPTKQAAWVRRFAPVLATLLPSDKDLKFEHRAEGHLGPTQLRLYDPRFVTRSILQKLHAEFAAVKSSGKSLGEQENRRREMILGPE